MPHAKAANDAKLFAFCGAEFVHRTVSFLTDHNMVPRCFRWNGLGGWSMGPPSPQPSPEERENGAARAGCLTPPLRPRLPVHRSPKGLSGWALSKSPEGGAGSPLSSGERAGVRAD